MAGEGSSVARRSMLRERFQERRMNPFFSRFDTCLWTVATELRPKCSAISSRLGE
jgi:hypothetical protein